jgi:hypothetical protein
MKLNARWVRSGFAQGSISRKLFVAPGKALAMHTLQHYRVRLRRSRRLRYRLARRLRNMTQWLMLILLLSLGVAYLLIRH